jgi:hypothetical protein
MCNPSEPVLGVGLCIVMAFLYVIEVGLSIDDANSFFGGAGMAALAVVFSGLPADIGYADSPI